MEGKRDPYAGMADFYDEMARDRQVREAYRYWRELLLQCASERKLEIRTLVDLMCGTGNTTIPWTRRAGWRVIGVDRSAALLRVARAKSDRVRWYRQDVRRLRLRERADAVTCHFDALNHILEPGEMQEAFRRVARILRPGGLFLFDLSTAAWFRWLDGRDKVSRIGRNFMAASNRYDPKSRIVLFTQHWFVPRGRLYERRTIAVRERAYPVAEIRAMARAAGFRVLQAEPQWRIGGKAVRRVFVLERRAQDPFPPRVHC